MKLDYLRSKAIYVETVISYILVLSGLCYQKFNALSVQKKCTSAKRLFPLYDKIYYMYYKFILNIAGCAGIMVGYPLDTVKVHMQTQDCRNPKYRGTWDCLRTILAKESVFNKRLVIAGS